MEKKIKKQLSNVGIRVEKIEKLKTENMKTYFVYVEEGQVFRALNALDIFFDKENAKNKNIFKVSVIGDYEYICLTEYIIE